MRACYPGFVTLGLLKQFGNWAAYCVRYSQKYFR